ncbi:MAG: UpxY family transcription antiterminator [Duncaniella sp.]|nr:UpxY family transcription antiterminator [Muribaculum sp.]MCM1254614.1 UpxY family transcription antiterminator [Duncaniella sp.]
MGVYKEISDSSATATHNADDAVGVSDAHWYIAIVNNRSERTNAERLTKAGIENYVPVQEELHLWNNGKKVRIERVMIPSKIFIRCTERQRREIVKLPFIFRFMTNKAGESRNSLSKPLAIVPAHEIDQLKFMLGVPDANVSFTDRFVKGEKVEVRRGPFKGLTGVVLEDTTSGTSHLFINIDFLGSAYVKINPKDVTPCQSKV